MEVKTHWKANPRLLGRPIMVVDEAEAVVELEAERRWLSTDGG